MLFRARALPGDRSSGQTCLDAPNGGTDPFRRAAEGMPPPAKIAVLGVPVGSMRPSACQRPAFAQLDTRPFCYFTFNRRSLTPNTAIFAEGHPLDRLTFRAPSPAAVRGPLKPHRAQTPSTVSSGLRPRTAWHGKPSNKPTYTCRSPDRRCNRACPRRSCPRETRVLATAGCQAPTHAHPR